jgi:maltooligosyltrehalose trehalohydrolase
VSGQAGFGPLIDKDGVSFRLWAPAARAVSVVLDAPIAMRRNGDWFVAQVAR